MLRPSFSRARPSSYVLRRDGRAMSARQRAGCAWKPIFSAAAWRRGVYPPSRFVVLVERVFAVVVGQEEYRG
ncbi:unnamed protein product [Soboliphyme baturini]|uniref:Transposase n=1 Tax=Soboliphyme baturini TaxID=241478 RepID=A0A183J7P8_9BILA|nr:unnamed protein product [Soboliphyme baturini]